MCARLSERVGAGVGEGGEGVETGSSRRPSGGRRAGERAREGGWGRGEGAEVGRAVRACVRAWDFGRLCRKANRTPRIGGAAPYSCAALPRRPPPIQCMAVGEDMS